MAKRRRPHEIICPNCGNKWHVSKMNLKPDGDYASRRCACRKCGATWYEWWYYEYDTSFRIKEIQDDPIQT